MIIIHSVLLVMGKVSDENCRGNKNKFYYVHTYIRMYIGGRKCTEAWKFIKRVRTSGKESVHLQLIPTDR